MIAHRSLSQNILPLFFLYRCKIFRDKLLWIALTLLSFIFVSFSFNYKQIKANTDTRIMSLSSREWEDLKSLLDKAVHKFLGFTEQSLVTAALNCIDKGYDKKKTIGKSGCQFAVIFSLITAYVLETSFVYVDIF